MFTFRIRIILCVVPIAMIIMALMNIYIRRVKTRANKAISKAGGIATETLSGIKTVASLCAQPYFGNEYQQQVRDSARSSVRASALSSLAAGVTGFTLRIPLHSTLGRNKWLVAQKCRPLSVASFPGILSVV